MSNRAHLLQVKKTLNKNPEGLAGPPFPERYAHVWDMFLDLHNGRSYSASGPNPLSWADIKAWNDLMDINLTESEVRTLKSLDNTWLASVREDDDG